MGKGGELDYISKSRGERNIDETKTAISPKAVDFNKFHPKLLSASDDELAEYCRRYGIVSADATRDRMLIELFPYQRGICFPNTPDAQSGEDDGAAFHYLPLQPPKFNFLDIKKQIPAHLFERSMTKSFYHLFSDLATIAITFYLATYIDRVTSVESWEHVLKLPHHLSPNGDSPDLDEFGFQFRQYLSQVLHYISAFLLWNAYFFIQGATMTGVWVIAHECGHQGFSASQDVNNWVGWVCHSLLLVPYHSWRISHAKHHQNTGSCENDEVFNPSVRSDWKNKAHEMFEEAPLYSLYQIVLMLTVGWIPGYLVLNSTGPKKYRGKVNDHFTPTSALFDAKDYMDIVVSDIGFIAAVALLFYCGSQFGALNVVFYYLLPYLWTNHNLVLITFLQHTDIFMPHFRASEWSWFRGALCTVDRSFGVYLDHAFHHIADSHVCHHLFSKMPFYNAVEATPYLRKALGKYYMKDETPIPVALWRAFTCCKYIDDEGDVVFYKNRDDLVAPADN